MFAPGSGAAVVMSDLHFGCLLKCTDQRLPSEFDLESVVIEHFCIRERGFGSPLKRCLSQDFADKKRFRVARPPGNCRDAAEGDPGSPVIFAIEIEPNNGGRQCKLVRLAVTHLDKSGSTGP